jgi:hypothetical protein
VYPGGLRHIRPDRRINEWRAPGRKTISRAATNERQVAIALSGGEVVYFELNPQVGGWAVVWRGGWLRVVARLSTSKGSWGRVAGCRIYIVGTHSLMSCTPPALPALPACPALP